MQVKNCFPGSKIDYSESVISSPQIQTENNVSPFPSFDNNHHTIKFSKHHVFTMGAATFHPASVLGLQPSLKGEGGPLLSEDDTPEQRVP